MTTNSSVTCRPPCPGSASIVHPGEDPGVRASSVSRLCDARFVSHSERERGDVRWTRSGQMTVHGLEAERHVPNCSLNARHSNRRGACPRSEPFGRVYAGPLGAPRTIPRFRFPLPLEKLFNLSPGRRRYARNGHLHRGSGVLGGLYNV